MTFPRRRAWWINMNEFTFVLLWLFVFAVPWEAEVVFPVELPLSHVIGIAVAVTGLGTALARRSVRRFLPLHYVAAALVAWATVSYGWSMAPDLTAVRIGSYIQLLLMVWLIWEFANDSGRQQNLIAAYVIGTWIAAGSTISAFITSTGAGNTPGSGRYTEAGENENELGIILAIGIAMASHLLSTGRRWQAFWFTSVPVFFLAIILTGSRGSFMASVIALSLFVRTLGRLRPALKVAGAVALIGLIIAAIVWLPDAIWTRVQSIPAELSQGTLTKRTNIWSAGLDAYRDHAFLGVGAGAFPAAVYKTLDIAYVAHNSYLSVLVELGVVGIILFGTLLMGLLHLAITLPAQHRRLWLTLLLTWGLAVSSVTWEHRKPTWFLFGLLMAQSSALRSPGIAARKLYEHAHTDNLQFA